VTTVRSLLTAEISREEDNVFSAKPLPSEMSPDVFDSMLRCWPVDLSAVTTTWTESCCFACVEFFCTMPDTSLLRESSASDQLIITWRSLSPWPLRSVQRAIRSNSRVQRSPTALSDACTLASPELWVGPKFVASVTACENRNAFVRARQEPRPPLRHKVCYGSPWCWQTVAWRLWSARIGKTQALVLFAFSWTCNKIPPNTGSFRKYSLAEDLLAKACQAKTRKISKKVHW